jgi:hypothetical protein
MTLRYTDADLAAKALEVEAEVAKEAEELLDSMKARPCLVTNSPPDTVLDPFHPNSQCYYNR